MSLAKSSNWSKAPQSAAFVKNMREVFGDVKVLYVKEGSLELGESTDPKELRNDEATIA